MGQARRLPLTGKFSIIWPPGDSSQWAMRMTIPAPAHRLPTLDYMLKLNEDPESIFYHKIDTDHIGIAGHSQGGRALIMR